MFWPFEPYAEDISTGWVYSYLQQGASSWNIAQYKRKEHQICSISSDGAGVHSHAWRLREGTKAKASKIDGSEGVSNFPRPYYSINIHDWWRELIVKCICLFDLSLLWFSSSLKIFFIFFSCPIDKSYTFSPFPAVLPDH